MKRILIIVVLLLFSAGFVFSVDFGLLVDQKIEAQNKVFTYDPSFTPWFSWDGGRGLSVYLSGVFSLDYHKYSDDSDSSGWTKPGLLPELSRFSLSYRPSQNLSLEAGRVPYTDTLGLTVFGLFDGLRIEATLPLGAISAGVFYTGLLYKGTGKIKISMTASDESDFAEAWAFDNFGAYFASRRAIGAFRWAMPLGEFNTLSLEALAQFDLNGADEALHSQYGEIKLEMFPHYKLGISLGALFEAMENKDGDFGAALGALARVKTPIPGSLNDSLSVTAKFSSGAWNKTFTGFNPISLYSAGEVFSSPLSGLALVQAAYNAALLHSLFAQASLAYFFRTYQVPDDGFLYGGEVWASLTWLPFDDLSVMLGGGAFFPGLGNISGEPQWKIRAGVSLSL